MVQLKTIRQINYCWSLNWWAKRWFINLDNLSHKIKHLSNIDHNRFRAPCGHALGARYNFSLFTHWILHINYVIWYGCDFHTSWENVHLNVYNWMCRILHVPSTIGLENKNWALLVLGNFKQNLFWPNISHDFKHLHSFLWSDWVSDNDNH